MKLKIGCDIVQITRFERSAGKGGKEFLDRVFSASELANAPAVATLAGMFAAKEAVMKALKMKAGDWHKIEIKKDENGRPEVKLLELDKRVMSRDMSISHDGEYAMAVAIFLVE